jgi:hypothetical protein
MDLKLLFSDVFRAYADFHLKKQSPNRKPFPFSDFIVWSRTREPNDEEIDRKFKKEVLKKETRATKR